MEIEIVKWFQSFSNNFLDGLNSVLTRFGEDLFFVCIFLLLYWCVSYNHAFKFTLFYCASVAVNSVIKTIVKRPRPWMASNLIENKLPASGFSFPSGHSQSISSICTYLTFNVYKSKQTNAIKLTSVIASVVLCIIVALTRLYLGQHYLTDVLTGLIIGTIVMLTLLILNEKFGEKFKRIKPEYVLATVSLIMLIAITVLSFNSLGLSYGTLSKIYKYTGLACGGTIGFIICNNRVENIATSFNQRVIKLIIGYVVVFGLYFLLRLIPSSFVSSFCIMLVLSFIATCVYPITYNYVYLKIKK